MKNFIDYLERMIEGCDSLGDMEREKATYQSVLKEYRKQCNIADVVEPKGKLETGYQCLMCGTDKPKDGHSCCEDCGGISF